MTTAVARRIEKLYRRPARVIYPPVDVESYRPGLLPREEFYVSVSRFVPYKRVDLIVEAFTRMGKPLVVIGEGSEFEKVRRAAGPNVKLLGHRSAAEIEDYLQRARAFVFAAEEDFGIASVEAQATGCPVIAYGKGGALETVIGWPAPEPTGVFFDAQTPEAIAGAVKTFEAYEDEFDPEVCRRNAELFGQQRFQGELRTTLEELWDRFRRDEALE